MFSSYGGMKMYETKANIDGMMCSMCTSHVNDCIRQNFSVKSVKATLRNNGETTILSETPIDEEKLREALGKLGYRLTGFSQKEAEAKKGLFGFLKK